MAKGRKKGSWGNPKEEEEDVTESNDKWTPPPSWPVGKRPGRPRRSDNYKP